MNRALLIALILFPPAVCSKSNSVADVTLPRVFNDYMVLQAGSPLPIRGTADAGEHLTVELGGVTKSVATLRHARYAWSPFPEPRVNFFNRTGLPASPFTTVRNECCE